MRPWAYACLAGGSALILAAAPAQYLGRQQDDLLYIIGSQSLAEGSYRLFTSVGRPLMTTITPGWPLLLLPLSLVCPQRLGAYEAFAALLQAAVPWAVFLWARRRLDDLTALLAALLCAASPLLLSQAGAVMSETPFLLAMLAYLAVLERAERGAGLKAGSWLGALFLLRPAALSLAPALACLRRSRAELRRACAAAAGAALGWIAVSRLAAALASADAGKLSYHTRSWVEPFSGGFLDKLRFYGSAWGGQFRGGAALGAALFALSAWGAAKALKRRSDDPAALALAGTVIMQAAWAWNYERYLIPALPLLWWAAALALGRAAKPALACLLGLELVFGAAPWVRGTTWRTPELNRTYAWLARELPPGEALASASYLRDGFHAGRPSMPLPDADTSEEFARRMRAQRVRFALRLDGLDIGTAERGSRLRGALDRAQAHLDDRSRFELVHEEGDEGARVYRLK